MATPSKCTQGARQKSSENSNPNLTSPAPKSSSSPSIIKSAKTLKSATKNPNPSYASPRKKIKERKFVVAKKKNPKKQESDLNCTCKDKIKGKCLCVAYENLRASQEGFFKSGTNRIEEFQCNEGKKEDKPIIKDHGNRNGYENNLEENEPNLGFEPEEGESPKSVGSSTIKRRRDFLMEEARESVPEPGSGRVLHLVKAFEKLLTMPKKSDEKEGEKETIKGMKWALPGLQQHPKAPETEDSSSAFCPGELFFTAESLGIGSNVSSSLDSDRGSISSRSSVGSRRSRRSSSFSSGTVSGRKWKKNKQLHRRVTNLRPFQLRTEQRGKAKEEEFIKKLQEMMIEEEKQRIPVAQGLPWTTDEPECLIKPAVKECTKPVDLKLHTDVRAVERAEFDQQVTEKLMFIEQYKMERERQQKLEEEEEIKRLRKELVPKAQPMPYFDRPFIPRRSSKQPTIPKDPRFHIPQHKKIKCCVSWNDLNEYIHTT